MKNDQEETQKPVKDKIQEGGNVLFIAASAHEACLAPFMRKNFGSEAPGIAGLLGCGLIIVYAMATGSGAMFVFFLVWIILVAQHRMQARARAKRGEIVHSRYTGWPALAMKIPFVRKELPAKLLIEPLICFVVGVLLCPVSIYLGAFVMAGMFSLRIKAGLENEVMRVRALRMRDAYIEQQQLNDRFQGYQ